MEAFLLYVCFCLAAMIVEGLKSKCFELSDTWKIYFDNKPIRFCALIIMYSLVFGLILYLACSAGYGLFIN